MIKVSIVGKGNVSHHLAQAISKTAGVSLLQVIDSRMTTFEEIPTDTESDHDEQKTRHPDVYILAVSDDALVSVSKKLGNTKSLVVHTSGSVSIDALPKTVRGGVFYPLQTFSKKARLDFKTIPICIEAEHENDLDLLNKLASSISNKVVTIDSRQRKSLHLAAVFVNNFVNHLYYLGQNICLENQVPFDVLLPLIQETAKKIEDLSPRDAQTGPAKRSDTGTMKEQLQFLKDTTQRDIYTLLSQSIQQTYGEKL